MHVIYKQRLNISSIYFLGSNVIFVQQIQIASTYSQFVLGTFNKLLHELSALPLIARSKYAEQGMVRSVSISFCSVLFYLTDQTDRSISIRVAYQSNSIVSKIQNRFHCGAVSTKSKIISISISWMLMKSYSGILHIFLLHFCVTLDNETPCATIWPQIFHGTIFCLSWILLLIICTVFIDHITIFSWQDLSMWMPFTPHALRLCNIDYTIFFTQIWPPTGFPSASDLFRIRYKLFGPQTALKITIYVLKTGIFRKNTTKMVKTP